MGSVASKSLPQEGDLEVESFRYMPTEASDDNGKTKEQRLSASQMYSLIAARLIV